MNLADHGCPQTDGFSPPHRKRCQVTTVDDMGQVKTLAHGHNLLNFDLT